MDSEINQSEAMEFDNKSKTVAVILYILTIAAIGFLSYSNKFDRNDIIKIEMIGIVEITIILLYLRIEKKEFSINKYYALAIGYTISLLLLMLFNYYELYNLVIIGPMFIAIIVDTNIGILTNVYLVLTTYLIWGVNLENAIYYLIFVTLACIISKYLKNNKLVIYIIIIMISTHIILSLVLNSFNYNEDFLLNLALSTISTIFALLIVYSLYYISTKFRTLKEKSLTDKEILHEDNITVNESIHENNMTDLLDKLKGLSEGLYNHSNQVANMCYKAAEVIGADALIAKQGGLYHEIGRINGKDYINEGIALASQYNFPKDVIDIIGQYSGLYELPQTKEAAIVMLTDSVVSTMDYVRSRTDKKPAPPEKIIEQIFIAKLSKNLLNESGMELEDYKLLRKFYTEEYSKGE